MHDSQTDFSLYKNNIFINKYITVQKFGVGIIFKCLWKTRLKTLQFKITLFYFKITNKNNEKSYWPKLLSGCVHFRMKLVLTFSFWFILKSS